MDRETREMFHAVLEEISRVEIRMEKRFDAVDERFERVENELEQLHHEVNACKFEKDTIQLLIKRDDQLEERLDDQEARILRLEEKRRKPQKKLQKA